MASACRHGAARRTLTMGVRMNAVLRHALTAVLFLVFASGASPSSGNVRADRVPPTVSIASPTAGATVGGLVTVSGVAADDVQVATVELKVDDGSYQPASGTSAWTLALDTTQYGDGSHTLTARATDSSGNEAWASMTVTFSNGSSSSIYWGAFMDGDQTYAYYYGGSWG